MELVYPDYRIHNEMPEIFDIDAYNEYVYIGIGHKGYKMHANATHIRDSVVTDVVDNSLSYGKYHTFTYIYIIHIRIYTFTS